jgi:hypothetical protein
MIHHNGGGIYCCGGAASNQNCERLDEDRLIVSVKVRYVPMPKCSKSAMDVMGVAVHHVLLHWKTIVVLDLFGPCWITNGIKIREKVKYLMMIRGFLLLIWLIWLWL